jgi:pimeloyl-ACP methyl ester carboxylesterase
MTQSPRERRIRLDEPIAEVKLAWLDWGPEDAARTIVCVHGLTRNARDFDALAVSLATRGARVLAVDVPGRGRSSWLPDPAAYAVPTDAAQLGKLLERLGLASVDWVGTSMGGLIGMALAAGEASPIERLVLNDIGPFVPRAALEQIRTYVGLDPLFADLAALEAYLRRVHAGFGRLGDSQWRHMAEHGARRTAEGWRLAYDPRIREPFLAGADADIELWDLWEQIACPTLVLRGVESTLLTQATAEAMRARGPKAELVLIPETGHAPALMTEDQIEIVRGWLKP